MEKVDRDFLTAEERAQLVRKHKKEKDGRLRDRLKFLILLNDGFSYSEIARVLLINDQTLRNHWKDFQQGGVEAVLRLHYTGRPSKLLATEREELEVYLTDNTYLSSHQIRSYIKETYGKDYSKTGVIALLEQMGFVYKKAQCVRGLLILRNKSNS